VLLGGKKNVLLLTLMSHRFFNKMCWNRKSITWKGMENLTVNLIF